MFKQVYHILSDLHLEMRPKITSFVKFIDTYKQFTRNGYDINDIENKNKILILAGDIGYPTQDNYWLFLNDCARIYKHVICIPGNHEYYVENYNINQINEIITKKTNEIYQIKNNFHYLNNNTVTIDNVKYIGSTLWSQLDKNYKSKIISGLNDFNYITTESDKLLTFEKYNQFHKRDLEWLQNEISKTKSDNNSNFIVITHHLPSNQLIHPKYKMLPYSNINSAFATNLDSIIQGKLWIGGHTHSPIITTINQTQIVVNPFGYANECLYAKINETIIEFD